MRRTRKNTKTNFRKTRRVKGGGQGQSVSTRDRLREKIQKEQADRMNINSILAKQAETDRAKEAVRERDRKRAEKIRIEIAEKKVAEEAAIAADNALKAAKAADKALKAAKAAAKAAVKTKTSSSRKPASTPTPKSPTPKSPTPPKPPTPKSPTPKPPTPKSPTPQVSVLKPPTPPLKLDTKTALKRENKIKKWTSTVNVPTSEFWKEFFKDDELQRLRVELNKPDL